MHEVASRRGGVLRPLGTRVVAEVRTLSRLPARRRLRPSDVALALVVGLGIASAACLQHTLPTLANTLTGERAGLSWPLAMLRLPGSLLAPAIGLPIWGALAQVLFCFGLAEVHLGRARVVGVLIASHVTATLFGRLFVALGPRVPFHLGLPRSTRWQRDTGPSAAVVGVGTYLGVCLKLPILTTILVASMVALCAVEPGLAGREHLVAIATGGVMALTVHGYRTIRDRISESVERAHPTRPGPATVSTAP